MNQLVLPSVDEEAQVGMFIAGGQKRQCANGQSTSLHWVSTTPRHKS